MRKLKLAGGVIAVALVAGGANLFAGVVNLTLDTSGTIDYQQQQDSPCIFSVPSCKGSFTSTAVPNGGNVTSWDLYSPVYAGSDILALFPTGFDVAIDMNQAHSGESGSLLQFDMLVNGSVVASVAGLPADVLVNFNGNGVSDDIITGIPAFLSTDTVQFHASLSNLSDGGDSMFLANGEFQIPPPEKVPEPTSILLMGSGLVALAFIARRKK